MCFRISFFSPYFIGLVFYISDRDLIVLVPLIIFYFNLKQSFNFYISVIKFLERLYTCTGN
jgi:hypothetical protein